jgi:hypothetical protein
LLVPIGEPGDSGPPCHGQGTKRKGGTQQQHSTLIREPGTPYSGPPDCIHFWNSVPDTLIVSWPRQAMPLLKVIPKPPSWTPAGSGGHPYSTASNPSPTLTPSHSRGWDHRDRAEHKRAFHAAGPPYHILAHSPHPTEQSSHSRDERPSPLFLESVKSLTPPQKNLKFK